MTLTHFVIFTPKNCNTIKGNP